MEGKMKVKNVLVYDLEQFQEDLVRELISNNISYVKVGNEFHFLDKIYRFFDICLVDNLSIVSDFDLFNLKEENFMCSSNETIFEEKKKVNYTKRKIKEDNRRANAKLNASLNSKVNNFRR